MGLPQSAVFVKLLIKSMNKIVPKSEYWLCIIQFLTHCLDSHKRIPVTIYFF
jgi:hypothetical protein